MSELVVTMADVRIARFCSSGMRVWFAHHGFDLAVFLREGLPASTFEATGDALALHLVATARARKENHGR
jgi:hypothetical protein